MPTFSILFSLAFLPFLILPFHTTATKCDPNDQNVLLGIKSHFNAPGESALTGWNTKQPNCCSWSGIQCNANGRVTYLDLSYNNLSGPIPATLSQLTSLTHLDLSSNNLMGPIPNSLGQLTNLTYLELFFNKLSGKIPSTLGQLTSLTFLDLANNRLSGSIPPSLSNLKKLTFFDLRTNRLTGSVPGSFGSFNNPNMALFLSANRLSGPLPRAFGKVNISTLYLSANKLSGDASFLFSSHKTAMKTLFISDNKFEFDFSKVEFPKSLNDLIMNKNKIYGSLPQQLGELSLGLFDVSHNKLCGPIPIGLKQFSPDKFGHNKCLCGVPLPPCK